MGCVIVSFCRVRMHHIQSRCCPEYSPPDKLERLWIGADISAIAVEHVQERLKEKRSKKLSGIML